MTSSTFGFFERPVRPIKTSRTFSVNLFIPPDHITEDEKNIREYQRKLNVYRRELSLPLSNDVIINLPQENLSDLIDIILAEDVRVVSFTFGILPKKYLDVLKSRGVYLMGTATTVNEAIL